MKKPETKQDDPAQSQRFIETALEAEASGGSELFQKVFKAVASQKPADKTLG